MKEEEIIKAIAEICGWHEIRPNPYSSGTKLAGFRVGEGKTLLGIPNYPNSKDAMHEALRVIYERPENHAILVKYETDLCNSVKWPLFATAFEEARSFLRAFDKWIED